MTGNMVFLAMFKVAQGGRRGDDTAAKIDFS
jgi:hypothetical protein